MALSNVVGFLNIFFKTASLSENTHSASQPEKDIISEWLTK